MSKHIGFRVYKNLSFSQPGVLKCTEVAGWIKYNRVMRFGCAMFLDGHCVGAGYLTMEQVDKVEQDLRDGKYPHITNCEKPMPK